MKKTLLSACLAGVALAVGLAAPASADEGSTIVTLNVTAAGGLTITVPATANLGNGTEGATVSGNLGPVTVLDQRALLNASWVTTVVATDFTTGAGTAEETIPVINVRYWSGPATGTAGSGTFTPGQPTAADAVIINVPRTAFTHTGGSGNNFATWNPTVLVDVPVGTSGGTYTGTVTHSVL
ncbi:hypothetical protein I0C86_22405 [Plantactinospora sp. S1510]|uniref:WxL domain-containing protein n=1 Tax=Plantactinospora alkalitolerans TaxID=2789879 RepID=A0ABS0GZQ7_9ACTN|nr:hypothetical protein [Plantactinospora alkalitolerans]MBF9131696.1 hypothetical protein [Plantactinospora alkalitolerans]